MGFLSPLSLTFFLLQHRFRIATSFNISIATKALPLHWSLKSVCPHYNRAHLSNFSFCHLLLLSKAPTLNPNISFFTYGGWCLLNFLARKSYAWNDKYHNLLQNSQAEVNRYNPNVSYFCDLIARVHGEVTFYEQDKFSPHSHIRYPS